MADITGGDKVFATFADKLKENLELVKRQFSAEFKSALQEALDKKTKTELIGYVAFLVTPDTFPYELAEIVFAELGLDHHRLLYRGKDDNHVIYLTWDSSVTFSEQWIYHCSPHLLFPRRMEQYGIHKDHLEPDDAKKE